LINVVNTSAKGNLRQSLWMIRQKIVRA